MTVACHRCGCKEHYQYDDGEDFGPGDEEWQRCAACGHIFHEDDGGYEDEDLTHNAKVQAAAPQAQVACNDGLCASARKEEM